MGQPPRLRGTLNSYTQLPSCGSFNYPYSPIQSHASLAIHCCRQSTLPVVGLVNKGVFRLTPAPRSGAPRYVDRRPIKSQ